MNVIFDAVIIVILAIVIDRYVGEVPNSIHPLRWMGKILDRLDGMVHNRSSKKNIIIGFLAYLLVFLLFTIVGLLITAAIRRYIGQIDPRFGEIVWIIATALLFKIQFAIFSFRTICEPICRNLEVGKVEEAAEKVQMIVSRNTKGMDAEHIASSCCETISENLVDSVYSPTFYFGLFGLPGAIMFRCANLMDAMWGYLNDKYRWLGFFPAKFDDVLSWATARISPYYISLAAYLTRMDYRSPVDAAREEHGKTPSPNSGWSMTATAAALGIGMEKKGVYYMGKGPLPTTADVEACLELTEMASILFMVTVTIIAYALCGVNVQIFFENLIPLP